MHVGMLCGCVVEVVCGKDVCVCVCGGGGGGGRWMRRGHYSKFTEYLILIYSTLKTPLTVI